MIRQNSALGKINENKIGLLVRIKKVQLTYTKFNGEIPKWKKRMRMNSIFNTCDAKINFNWKCILRQRLNKVQVSNKTIFFGKYHILHSLQLLIAYGVLLLAKTVS